MSVVYLDYNATTPLAPEVLSVITTALRDAWGNPSSGHHAGSRPTDAQWKYIPTLLSAIKGGDTAMSCTVPSTTAVKNFDCPNWP